MLGIEGGKEDGDGLRQGRIGGYDEWIEVFLRSEDLPRWGGGSELVIEMGVGYFG